MDALYAIILMEISVDSAREVLPRLSPVQATFPDDPRATYRSFAKQILMSLNLEYLWRAEEKRLDEEDAMDILEPQPNLRRGVSVVPHFPATQPATLLCGRKRPCSGV